MPVCSHSRPQGQIITDAQRPLIDRVKGGREHQEDIRRWQHIGHIGLLVLAAHEIASQPSQVVSFDKRYCTRCENDAHLPISPLQEGNSIIHLWRCSCCADNEIQNLFL
jgi:hypothetical protein